MEENNVAQNPPQNNTPQVQQPVQPVENQTETKVPPSTKSKLPLILVAIFALLIILASGAYYFVKNSRLQSSERSNGGQANLKLTQISILSPTPTSDPTANPDLIGTNWRTYQNKEAGFEFKYPSYLEKLIQNPDPALRNFWVEIEKRDGLNNPYKEKECPGSCGRFAKDSNLYQKQFDLLTQASNTKDCIFDKNYVDDFKNFILFYGGIPGKWTDIQGIKLDNRVCGIKYGALDGYDVSHGTYNYRLVYIINDKAVGINFPIFPFHVFNQVDSFYTNLGFDLSGDSWSCRDNCKEGQFFNDQVFQNMAKDDTVKSVIQTYDEILSTFKFTP